ncbi:hypothetical protein [Aquitalea sp. ASV11]|uniref:hypothetical protein n=1 Tax=Aquitalea sp. ASV11 TaxID=2795103 RepID=UPI0018EC2083|nr:hypothetical protein [Aquitalea sp. ASV11]
MSIAPISASAGQSVAPVSSKSVASTSDTDNDTKTSSTQPKPIVDKVTISPAAKALQEATETAAQTAKEANSGDAQAKRKLATENASKA